MPKILVADSIAEEGLRLLRREDGFQVDVRLGLNEDALVEAIPAYDGLLVRSAVKVTARVLQAGRNLKIVGRAGIGVDNIDVEAATRCGVLVMNTPFGNVSSAAEHTLALLFASARNIARADRLLREKRWERNALTGVELAGKTLGIVGAGKVGSQVARVAKALEMRVLAFDPFLTREKAEEMGLELVTFDALIEQADFVTIHTPLTDKTRDMFGPSEFKRMRKGARVINCARGGIVNEKALVEALSSKQIAGAALDVFEKEPLGEHPLLALDNVTLTPHLGASTEEAQLKVSVDVARQCIDFFKRGLIQNSVNVVGLGDPQLAPFVALAELLGTLAGTLAGGAVLRVEVTCLGELASRDTRAVTVAALRGVLVPVCGDRVNLVNARVIAQERGIATLESRSTEARDYISLVTVHVETEGGRRTVSGTLRERKDPRIVRIDGFEVDLKPSANMIVMFYPDRPGMVGKFGTITGKANINIARMEVGRAERGQQAVVILTVDDPVPPAILDELKAATGGQDVHLVTLRE